MENKGTAVGLDRRGLFAAAADALWVVALRLLAKAQGTCRPLHRPRQLAHALPVQPPASALPLVMLTSMVRVVVIADHGM